MWKMLLDRETPGQTVLAACHYNSALDKLQKMDGWILVIYFSRLRSFELVGS